MVKKFREVKLAHAEYKKPLWGLDGENARDATCTRMHRVRNVSNLCVASRVAWYLLREVSMQIGSTFGSSWLYSKTEDLRSTFVQKKRQWNWILLDRYKLLPYENGLAEHYKISVII